MNKLKFGRMNYILLVGVFFIFPKICYSEILPFKITTLDSPSPGYLRFGYQNSSNFFLVDNSGYPIYETETKVQDNLYLDLKNGNWAQKDGEKFWIYNQNLEVIDSIPNPYIGGQIPYYIDWHELISLSNGHYLLLLNKETVTDMSKIVELGKESAILLTSVLVETDRTGTIYWEWNSIDHLNILDVTSDVDLTLNVIDLTHINSLVEDSDGNIIISIRHYDEVSKINKSNGEFIWRLGGTKCRNNQFIFINDDQSDFKGFSHQHSVSLLDNGNILLYDNGNMKFQQYSRAVEYQMNYNLKTATNIWQARKNPDIFQGAMGSVQRLPNGNTLINWGFNEITEVRPDNSVAYNLVYSDVFQVTYKACRVITKMDAVIKNIASSGNYSFNDSKYTTGLTLSINSLTGSSKSSVEKHYYKPQNSIFADTTFSSILPYRWVFNDFGISSISGNIKIDLGTITSINPLKATIYKRSKEGEGIFEELATSYNSSSNELVGNFSGNGEFVIGLNFVSVPNLSLPVDGSISSTTGTISWATVQGANNFQIQIDTTFNFSNPIINQLVGKNYKYDFANLMNSTKYFWRVRALNSKDTSSWSSIRSFTTILAKPILNYPENNSYSNGLVDTLKWDKVSLAADYLVQISTSQLFSDIFILADKLSNNQIIINNLSNNSVYYWRVKASNKNNSSDWSDIWHFSTIMESPRLIYPKNDTLNIPISLKLTWNNVFGTNNYLVQISENPKFEGELFVNSFVQGNSYDIENLRNDSKYYWRIKAVRVADSSNWSEIWNFTTKLISPEPIQPPNLQLNISINCTFIWEDNYPKATYNFQLSTSSDFSNLIVNKNLITEKRFTVKGLKPYTKYFWHVKSNIDGKESEWSSICSFITDKGIQLNPPKLISPKDKSDSYIKGTLTWLGVENAIKYRIQISNFELFNDVIKDTLIDNITSYNYFKLSNDNVYFWRVKALSDNDSSSWSSVWSFKISKKLETVRLLSPANDNMQVPVQGDLEWEPIEAANYYQLQISLTPDFENLISDINNILGTKYHYSNLDLNETYYWRVKFVREYDTSSWSNSWSFNTITSHVLNIPKLLSPIDGAEPVDVSGIMTWASTSDATKYTLSLSLSPSFETISIKENGIKDEQYEYYDLHYNTKYFWRVSAQNDSSKSNWSGVQYFTTELEPPEITYPENNSTNIPLQTEIKWKVNDDNSYYILQLAKDIDFNELYFESIKLSDLKFGYFFDGNADFYCRVKAVSETNYSKWSKVIAFKTLDPNSVSVSQSIDLIIYPNPMSNNVTFNFSIEKPSFVSLKIIDIFGKEVKEIFSEHLEQGNYKYQWNAKNVNSGIYFLEMLNGNLSNMQKILILK